MTQLDLTEHLTPGVEGSLARNIGLSHKGQAHFAGTGPSRKTCRECAWWGQRPALYYSSGSQRGARLKPDRCNKFFKLTGRYGHDVPHDALACKYFEPADTPPPVMDSKS